MKDSVGLRDGSDSQSAPQSTSGLSSTLVLALGTFAVGTDAFIISAFLPAMAEGLSVTPAVAGYSMTAFALAYAVLARSLLIGALVILGLANIGSALAPTFGILIVTRIAAAAAAAAYTPNAGAVAAFLVRPELRARALAVVIGGLSVSTALGVPLGHIASTLLSWRASLALVGFVAFAAMIGVIMLMPRLPGGTRVTLLERLSVLRRPSVLIVLPLTVLGMAACYTPFAFTIPLLQALSIQDAGITGMLICYGLGAVAGNYASGTVTDRLGPLRVLGGACLLLAATLGALLWLSLAPPQNLPIVVGLLMLCWGAGSWSQTPPQQMRLIASAPAQAPLVIALNSSAIYIGIAIGSALGSGTIGLGVPATLGTGFALAAAALLYVGFTWWIQRRV